MARWKNLLRLYKKANLRMIKSMVREFIIGMMVEDMRVIFKITNSMDLVNII